MIVSADEFKFVDPRLEGLHDAHSFSAKSAEELLVAAINECRDIVFDSTMMWAPFICQVIAMAREAHVYKFTNGPGYVPEENVEQYFVKDAERLMPEVAYVVRLIGVFVDPVVAVPRAILRQLEIGRRVPTRQQLRSFRLFSEAFETYVDKCDEAVLYDNNTWIDLEQGEIPKIAAQKRPSGKLEVLDVASYRAFCRLRFINDSATCEDELYTR